jgi:hypothetical protein
MNQLDLLNRAGTEPPSGLTVPQQALWWLKKGKLAMGPEWSRAHALCQQDEGNPAHDLVHALAHWIEGDILNAAYWYRRVGRERAETIALEWELIASQLGSSA